MTIASLGEPPAGSTPALTPQSSAGSTVRRRAPGFGADVASSAVPAISATAARNDAALLHRLAAPRVAGAEGNAHGRGSPTLSAPPCPPEGGHPSAVTPPATPATSPSTAQSAPTVATEASTSDAWPPYESQWRTLSVRSDSKKAAGANFPPGVRYVGFAPSTKPLREPKADGAASLPRAASRHMEAKSPVPKDTGHILAARVPVNKAAPHIPPR